MQIKEVSFHNDHPLARDVQSVLCRSPNLFDAHPPFQIDVETLIYQAIID